MILTRGSYLRSRALGRVESGARIFHNFVEKLAALKTLEQIQDVRNGRSAAASGWCWSIPATAGVAGAA